MSRFISTAQTGLCEPCEPAKNEFLALVEPKSVKRGTGVGFISTAQTGLCEPCEPAKNELLGLVEPESVKR